VAIVDFKYIDDKSLLVLCSQKGKDQSLRETAVRANNQPEEPRSVLLRIAYRSPRMPFQGHTEGQLPSVLELSSTGSEGVSSCFAFSHMSGFTPIQMEVQRASNLRGEISARVCLLGRDRAMLKTYALPEDLAGQESGR
jgi:anaphase-promoting complex subunit 4